MLCNTILHYLFTQQDFLFDRKGDNVTIPKMILVKLAIPILLVTLLMVSGCKRELRVTLGEHNPKQGDNIEITIDDAEPEEVNIVEYRINDLSGTTTTLPRTLTIDVCKRSPGYYPTELSIWVRTTYEDGETDEVTRNYDLTTGRVVREDGDLTFGIYVAHEESSKREKIWAGMANAFQKEFDSYTDAQYFWSHPDLYKTHAIAYANSVDLLISFGHGCPHWYWAGTNDTDWVDLSTTEFGNFAPCYETGDLEYFAASSCSLLALRNDGTGVPFWDYWFHREGTHYWERPFTGLHMVCGFRSKHYYYTWHYKRWKSTSERFFRRFASYLDNDKKVVEAWMEAAADKLSFKNGNNRTAVIYIEIYRNDIITTAREDYIHRNPEYARRWVEFYE